MQLSSHHWMRLLPWSVVYVIAIKNILFHFFLLVFLQTCFQISKEAFKSCTYILKYLLIYHDIKQQLRNYLVNIQKYSILEHRISYYHLQRNTFWLDHTQLLCYWCPGNLLKSVEWLLFTFLAIYHCQNEFAIIKEICKKRKNIYSKESSLWKHFTLHKICIQKYYHRLHLLLSIFFFNFLFCC